MNPHRTATRTTRWIVLTCLLGLAACGGGGGGGGGGDSGSTPPPPPPATATGIFVDSPVAGLRYTSGSQTGVTDANGQFTYVVGQPVIFSIGDTQLPAVTGGAYVNPLLVFGTTDVNDVRVVNLARLLQTLDVDANAGNGITLAAAAHTAATGLPAIDFSSPGFDTSATVLNLLANGGGGNTLVSASQAVAHLRSQISLAGTTWYNNGVDDGFVATFLADGTYIIGTYGDVDVAGWPGVEHGTYNWDPATGVVTVVSIINQTDGNWGLSQCSPGACFVQIRGDTLTFTNTNDPSSDATATRLVSTTSPIVGSWRGNPYPDPTDALSLTIITFFSDSTYAMYEDGTVQNASGGPGIEYGTYSWNSSTGALTYSVTSDTGGDWGLSSAGAVTITISGNTLNYADGTGGTRTATRVTGAVTGLSTPGGVAVDAVNNEVFVTNVGNDSITVYSRTANGNVAPIRTIAGAATGLSSVATLAVDTTNNEIVVANEGNNSITVYSRTANGNAAPVRTIMGAATGLGGAAAIAIDRVNDEILAANSANNTITVYNRTANGNVAPLRTITGVNAPEGIAVDTVNNEILAASYVTDSISVYSRTASGNAAPIRTISGATTGLTGGTIVVDPINNEIIASNEGDDRNSITVYSRTANGNAAPLRTISGAVTGLNSPYAITLDTTNNEIFAANALGHSVTVYGRTTNGNAAPSRTIQ